MFFGKSDKDVRLTDKQYKDMVSKMSVVSERISSADRKSLKEIAKATGLMPGWTSKTRWMSRVGSLRDDKDVVFGILSVRYYYAGTIWIIGIH